MARATVIKKFTAKLADIQQIRGHAANCSAVINI